jgi:hypothetical protein
MKKIGAISKSEFGIIPIGFGFVSKFGKDLKSWRKAKGALGELQFYALKKMKMVLKLKIFLFMYERPMAMM